MEGFDENKVGFPSPKAVLVVVIGYLIVQVLTWWIGGASPWQS
jgi:hypothetical protein